MNKLIATTVTAGLFLLATVMNAAAWCGAHGAGGCSMTDYSSSSVSAEALAGFNKETAALKEKLIDKCGELQKEYIKTQPDPDKTAKLRKEMIDLQAAIQKVANKYGITNARCSHAGGKGGCCH